MRFIPPRTGLHEPDRGGFRFDRKTHDMNALFTIDDVGALLGISSPTAYRLARKAKIATVSQGRKRGFTKDAVHEIIDAIESITDEERHYFKKLASQGRPAVKKAIAARRWISTTEVSCLLDTSRNTTLRWVALGAFLPVRDINSCPVFDVKDIVAYAVKAGVGIEWYRDQT